MSGCLYMSYSSIPLSLSLYLKIQVCFHQSLSNTMDDLEFRVILDHRRRNFRLLWQAQSLPEERLYCYANATLTYITIYMILINTKKKN